MVINFTPNFGYLPALMNFGRKHPASHGLHSFNFITNVFIPNIQIQFLEWYPGIPLNLGIIQPYNIHGNLEIFQGCVKLTFSAANFLNCLFSKCSRIPGFNNNFTVNKLCQTIQSLDIFIRFRKMIIDGS